MHFIKLYIYIIRHDNNYLVIKVTIHSELNVFCAHILQFSIHLCEIIFSKNNSVWNEKYTE